MFNSRGGFPGQRPMGPPRMNQPGLNHLGMNMSGMNMSGMNMSGMGMSSMNQPNMGLSGMNQPNMNLSGMNQPNMNQPNMNLSSMNQPNMNTGMNRMGPPGMNTNVGLGNVNPPGGNVYRMGPTGMNQGGMGFQPEIKNQGYGMRPMDSPGSFLGGSSEPMGMKGMPMRTPERHMTPQGGPQRFPPPSSPMTPSQPRMMMQNQEIPSIVNRVLQHSSDHMRPNPKPPLQEPSHLMEKKPLNPLSMFGNLSQEMGMKPGPSSLSNPQNRYTNESASSILESFGLSNEDLEELSRYPDEQLTPANLPNILRDIRLRKINRSGDSHDQGGGRRRSGGEVLPSKVIDYGHSSKYQYNDNPGPFDSSRKGQKTLPASKEPAPSNSGKGGKGKIAMDNKIPTISSNRKTAWPPSKMDRSNNKTLVGEQTTSTTSDSSGTALKKESPVITIKPDSSTLCDIPVMSDKVVTASPSNMATQSPIETVVSQVNYPPPAEATNNPTGKGSWVPSMSQDEAQKMKRMPTPSMMNDYFAASPRIFPHICSLCNVECRHLKDWIKHQNNTSHIDSCRKLRQQYPEWNPQVHTLRNDAKKDEKNPKRSRSKSGSPRRSRRSNSRSRSRRSRSRSPRSARRSRSRSPRRIRHSPRRSRSPRKGGRSPRRSLSPRRSRRGRSSTPPDKRAVDAAVQSYIEASKLKSGEKPRSASDGKKLPAGSANSNVKGKKPASVSTPTKNASNATKKTSGSTSSGSSKKPESGSSVKSGSSSNGSASRAPLKKPLPSTKKPVVSTGAKKTTPSTALNKKPPNKAPPNKAPPNKAPPNKAPPNKAPPNKAPPNKASNAQRGPKQPSKESYSPLNKFTSKSGSAKIIHVTNLPDSGYTDQDILKIVQPFGKVGDILIVRSKNEAFLETNFKEAAAAAVKFSETVPVIINGKRVMLSLAGQRKEQPRKPTKGTSDAASGKSSQKDVPAKEQKVEKPLKNEKAGKEEKEKKKSAPKHDIEVPPGFVKCHRLTDLPLKEEEKCIVVISNLPEKQYTVEEVSNLARPFGGVNDILIIANHRKAYLELPSRNSVDSMLKFYNVFPTCLSGSTLNIAMAPAYKDLKDENRIFAEIIEQASFKITPTIYEKFVHLSNLPDKEIQEFELTRIGLRFGKVEHYVLLSNKKKAILHMNSRSAASSMHSFLSRFPARIADSVLKCTLVSMPKLSEHEYITYLEEKSSEPDHKMCEDVASTPDGNHIAGTYSNVEVEEDNDDEEAAEAPEAPEAPSCFVEPEPVEEKPAYKEDPRSYVTEESDVLVSVESDEECDAPFPDEPNAIPVMDCVSMENLLTAEDSDESESNDMETSAYETETECPKPVEDQNFLALEQKPEDATNEELPVEASQPPETTAEPADGKESENTSVVIGSSKEETSLPKAEDSSDKDTKSESDQSLKDGKTKRSEEAASSHDEKSRQKRGRSGQSSHGKNSDEVASNEESKDSELAAMPGKPPVTRTTKYNPQRGELSVTLSVDGQKSSSRGPDSKKRFPGDKGPSGKESSIPKSSSNRSSPAESSSSNPKTSSGSYQMKSSYRGTSSQDRDSKVSSRSRDSDFRSNRKDDRSKDSNSSSSSRHMRSSNRSTRGQRSKEEGFPFNLDEFVTVDEIVEEHIDSTKEAKDGERKSPVISKDQSTKRGGKRKETHPSASDAKKVKEASGDPQELSFVTLDEVGDEEDNTTTPESTKDEAVLSEMKEGEVQAEDKADTVKESTPRTQEPNVLMTLDEVSDDDEPNASAGQGGSSTIPDKDQLLTLDEISGEDEEQTSHSEPCDPDKWLTQEVENKEGDSSVDPETKNTEVPDVAPQDPEEENHTEQPLLTLDEVKADDEEDYSLADIEHHFLTVDEIGEEEDDSVDKEEDVEESQPESASKPGQTKSKTSPKSTEQELKTPAGRRGRPRKRPLSESTADNKDTTKQTSDDSGTVSETVDKTPTKPKSKSTEQAEADVNTMTTTDKSGSGTPKNTETPAKKTKLESPSEKPKLSPFNSSVPVGLEFLVPKTGYFCELCSLFYMDDASKIKHCKSLRHYQAVQKKFASKEKTEETKSLST